MDRALAEEQIVNRDMIVKTDHTLGGIVRTPNTPFTRIKGMDPAKYSYPPLLGEHTGEVLKSLSRLLKNAGKQGNR